MKHIVKTIKDIEYYNSIKNYVILLFLTFSCFSIKAQVDGYSFDKPEHYVERIPKSPDVAELGRFGDLDVGKYTGTANINVPIHAIDFDGISIPIALSYNSSGIRVSQEATWVGLGWNLSANAIISRKVNGFDDLVEHRGYVYNQHIVPDPNFLKPKIKVQDSIDLVTAHLNRTEIDVEPDIFTVNLFGRTYNFSLTKIIDTPPNSIYVEGVNYDNAELIIHYYFNDMRFEITDAQGFRYFFTSREISDSYRTIQSPYNFTNGFIRESDVRRIVGLGVDRGKVRNKTMSWFLDKIESPYNRTLFFEYDDGAYLTYPSFSNSVSLNPNGLSEFVVYDNKHISLSIDCNITGIQTKYLKRIHGDFGEINFGLTAREDLYNWTAHSQIAGTDNANAIFNPGNIQRKLSMVTVENKAGDTLKTAQLNYTYFNENRINDSEREGYLRLKLDSVLVNDQLYTFEYEQPNALPKKDAPSQDFWGFYNGEDNTSGPYTYRIPTFGRFVRASKGDGTGFSERYLLFEGANRRSNFNFGKIGMLTKITYPTKGYSIFEYEGNRATVETPETFIGTPNNNVDPLLAGDSPSLKYSFQYLERASLQSSRSLTIGPGDEFTINGTAEIPFSENFQVSFDVSCSFGASSNGDCSPSSNNIYIVMITDVNNPNTIYVSDELTFNNAPSDVGTQQSYSTNFNLPNGTYQVTINSNSADGYSLSNLEMSYIDAPPVPQFPSIKEFEVGGIRVKSITNKDSDDSFISKKRYEYRHDTYGVETSSGILMDELIFHSKQGYFDYTPEGYDQTIFNLSSSMQLSGPGSHVSYSKVTEFYEDHQGTTNGSKESIYYNTPNEHHTRFIGRVPEHGWYNFMNNLGGGGMVVYQNVYYLGITPNSFEHLNGKLKEEVVLNSNNRRVKYTTNEYQTKLVSTLEGWKVQYAPINIPHYLRYNLYGKVALLDSTVIEDYFQENTPNRRTVRTVMSYEYNSKDHNGLQQHFWPTRTTTTNSENEIVSVETIYPPDSQRNNMPELTLQNRRATPVEVKGFTNNIQIGRKVTDYESKATIYQPVSIKTQKQGEPLSERLKFERYDIYGNLLQYRTNNEVPVAYLYGYHNRMYPVAKVENATYDEVIALLTTSERQEIESASITDVRLAQLLQKVRDGLPDALVATYTHKQGVGISTSTDARGYKMTYIYDDSNRLIEVRDASGKLVSENEYHYKNQN